VQVTERKSLKDIAYDCVNGGGSNYLMESGHANFPLVASTPMGPIQDTYDTMLSRAVSTFLGLGYYDCLLCHNGRGHLDQLSLWGRSGIRMDAQRMAAFFSRLQFTNHPETTDPNSYFFNSRLVTERTTGQYDLNTTNGNRPVRCAPGASVVNNRCSATLSLTPEYHYTAAKPAAGRMWRESFADNMVWDPLFSKNLANRIWKQMFNLGLVDPVDTFDPARLDSKNPPPEPWTLQATHPQLLDRLAEELYHNNFNLREMVRLIAESSAYQLSSRYAGEWKLEYVPLFARHYPRRLEGEEVADAVVKATAVANPYAVQGYAEPMRWAMQLPEPLEPRNNAGNALNFMNAFLRGNRDTQQRNQSGSILQQLNLMNDQFVLNRVKVGASAPLRALANTANNQQVVDDLYLLFLGRSPSAYERSESVNFLAKAATQAARNTAVEDLAWTMINRLEFIFSY
jgi:hypothetical protein